MPVIETRGSWPGIWQVIFNRNCSSVCRCRCDTTEAVPDVVMTGDVMFRNASESIHESSVRYHYI